MDFNIATLSNIVKGSLAFFFVIIGVMATNPMLDAISGALWPGNYGMLITAQLCMWLIYGWLFFVYIPSELTRVKIFGITIGSKTP